MSNDKPGGGQRPDLQAVYLVVGVLLIIAGVSLLGGSALFGWVWPWGVLRDLTRELRRVGWPLAVIAIGILVIVYSRRPGARLPSKEARLFRSRTKKVIAGVFGGLSDYFSVDVALLRVGYVLFALVFDAWGPLLIAYVAAAIIVPLESEMPPDDAPVVSKEPPPPPADAGPPRQPAPTPPSPPGQDRS